MHRKTKTLFHNLQQKSNTYENHTLIKKQEVHGEKIPSIISVDNWHRICLFKTGVALTFAFKRYFKDQLFRIKQRSPETV